MPLGRSLTRTCHFYHVRDLAPSRNGSIVATEHRAHAITNLECYIDNSPTPQAKEDGLRTSVTELQAKVQALQLRRRQLAKQNATLKHARAAHCAGATDRGPRWPDPSDAKAQAEQACRAAQLNLYAPPAVPALWYTASVASSTGTSRGWYLLLLSSLLNAAGAESSWA